MFEHLFLPKIDGIQQVNFIDGKPVPRFYLYKGDHYTSCTTLIGKMLDTVYGESKAIEEWKKKVGEKEANAIRDRAGLKGTALHEMCEQYLNNEPISKTAMPQTVFAFNKIKPYLDEHVDIVHGLEHRALTKKYMAAGTIDLICTWDGKPTIVDFKTARKKKKKSHILKYFLQATMYAQMAYDTFGMKIEKLVIIIAVEDEPTPQRFIFDADKFVPALDNIYSRYQEAQLRPCVKA